MEVQKEAFDGLMEYYKQIPIETKRIEIINELENLISTYTKLCTKLGIVPDMTLNKEMLNSKGINVKEDDFLHAIFAYINALQDISAQFIDKIADIINTSKM